jgi:hypothetical protein
MNTRAKGTTQTVEQQNAAYAQRQMTMSHAFRSPLAMLNVTVNDCNLTRAALEVSDETFARDRAIFVQEIDALIATYGLPDTNEKVDYYLHAAFSLVTEKSKHSLAAQTYWPLVACYAALEELHSAQQRPDFKVDALTVNVALFAQGMMNIAWKPERMRQKDQLLDEYNALATLQQDTNRILNQANAALEPLAKHGDRFRPGKPKGSLSPLATTIKKYLAKHQNATSDEVWEALKLRPPRGHHFCENSLGRYVEYDQPGKNTEYRTFQNLVSKHRPKREIG